MWDSQGERNVSEILHHINSWEYVYLWILQISVILVMGLECGCDLWVGGESMG